MYFTICFWHLTEPRTTAPVYLKGSLAANPYTVFWYIPFTTVNE